MSKSKEAPKAAAVAPPAAGGVVKVEIRVPGARTTPKQPEKKSPPAKPKRKAPSPKPKPKPRSKPRRTDKPTPNTHTGKVKTPVGSSMGGDVRPIPADPVAKRFRVY
jgi:hypothetical protein